MPKIELLDGAMGSEFIKRGYNLPEHIWSANMNIENSDTVYDIHMEYINAGSNYITTNTFRTTPRSYMKTGLNINEATIVAKKSLLNAAEIAKKAANNSVKVLGSIAPLEDCYMPNLFPGKNIAKKEYQEIAKWLDESNIDIFLIETMNSIQEAEICIKECSKYNRPIWVSFSLLDKKKILSGEKLIDAIKMTNTYDVDAFLINCTSLYSINYCLDTVSDNCEGRWGVYPNLGIGNISPDGNIKSIHSNDDIIRLFYNVIDHGGTLIGTCCGSSPKHINLLKNKVLK